MLQKPSQVVPEQILTLYFKCQASLLTICSMLLQMSSDFSSVLSTASLRLGACGPCIQRLDRTPGALYSGAKPTNKSINLIAFLFS